MERIADYIIRKVNEVGAEHIFLITGRGILYLTDAVAKNKCITPVSAFHEQGASYAAMAYASVNQRVGACLVSTGCAAANAVAACLCAYQDNLPVLFVSGQNMLHETTRYTGAPIRTYGSQEADIVRVIEPVTKYAVMLTDPGQTRYEVEKALYLAQEGRRGPVWIDVPLDIQDARIEPGQQPGYTPEDMSEADLDSAVRKVAEELSRAQRPVLLIGGGTAGAAREVALLSESLRLPVTFSPSAADVYGASHELSIGAVGSLGGSRAGNFTVQNADFILAIGTRLCTQETGRKENFARQAAITVVDIDEKEHEKEGVHIDRVIVSDARTFLQALIGLKLPRVPAAWVDKCMHWKTVFSIQNEPFVKELAAANQLDLYTLADSLNDILPDDATIITDAGFEELIIPSAIQYKEGQRCLFPKAQGAMGYAIPAILGAHYAGRKNLLAVVGDGSFMMNMQELGIIAANKVSARILVINNNMYAVIRKRQRDLFRSRTIGNDPSDGVPAPDFRKIAECFGFSYRKIESLTEWNASKGKLFTTEGPLLWELICTPEQKYLHESYSFNEKRRIVRRPIEDMSPFLDRELIRSEMIAGMIEE